MVREPVFSIHRAKNKAYSHRVINGYMNKGFEAHPCNETACQLQPNIHAQLRNIRMHSNERSWTKGRYAKLFSL